MSRVRRSPGCESRPDGPGRQHVSPGAELRAAPGGGIPPALTTRRPGPTVKTHLNRVMSKLNLASRAQAVVLAYESGLITPGRAALGRAALG
ncbi:hypothetical protein P3T39_001926 [Kitasatospora sp. GP82]|nr:hypothetical protein [Kitasatospora sp. GP82]